MVSSNQRQTERTMAEPTPPAGLAEYVREGVERQDTTTLRGIAEWAEALAEYRERPVSAGEIEADEGESIEEVGGGDGEGTRVLKKIPCGKDCGGCPHGPYVYYVKRVGGKLDWSDYRGRADG